jgi:hypothetical protein
MCWKKFSTFQIFELKKKFVFYKLRWDSLFCDYGTFYNMHKFHELMLIEELTHSQSLNFGFYCLCMCHCHPLLYTKIKAHHFYVLLIIRSCSFAGLSLQFSTMEATDSSLETTVPIVQNSSLIYSIRCHFHFIVKIKIWFLWNSFNLKATLIVSLISRILKYYLVWLIGGPRNCHCSTCRHVIWWSQFLVYVHIRKLH